MGQLQAIHISSLCAYQEPLPQWVKFGAWISPDLDFKRDENSAFLLKELLLPPLVGRQAKFTT